MKKMLKIFLMAATLVNVPAVMVASEVGNVMSVRQQLGIKNVALFGGLGAGIWGGWQLWQGIRYSNRKRAEGKFDGSFWKIAFTSRATLVAAWRREKNKLVQCRQRLIRKMRDAAYPNLGQDTEIIGALQHEKSSQEVITEKARVLIRIHDEARLPHIGVAAATAIVGALGFYFASNKQ